MRAQTWMAVGVAFLALCASGCATTSAEPTPDGGTHHEPPTVGVVKFEARTRTGVLQLIVDPSSNSPLRLTSTEAIEPSAGGFPDSGLRVLVIFLERELTPRPGPLAASPSFIVFAYTGIGRVSGSHQMESWDPMHGQDLDKDAIGRLRTRDKLHCTALTRDQKAEELEFARVGHE